MTDQAIEQEIQDKGLTAPRITPDAIEANISAEFYFTADDGIVGSAAQNGGYEPPYCIRNDDGEAGERMEMLTFCVLMLKNGFTVTGESACVSVENFDDEIGRKIARQNAVAKIWPLMGYELKQKLFEKQE